jgi:triacylglycerol esterase/lipase EstA (alpha/beta hydrolase family)
MAQNGERARECKVFLVPGFFGFKSLGAFNYFHRVSDVLKTRLTRRFIQADMVECRTQPTGSIRRRADRLLQDIIDSGGLRAEEIHLIGHSTGGLDIRLLLTPGVQLRAGDAEEIIARKTKTAVFISTPHYGTPLAGFFTTLQGRHLLQVLTLLATTTSGRRAIFLAAQALTLVARLDDLVGLERTVLDTLAKRLLDRLTLNGDDPIWRFLDEVASDQGAIIQLTPEGMNLFNAAVTDRPTVAYGSVLTAAPPPFAHHVRDLLSLEGTVMAVVFGFLHKLAAREHSHYPYPIPPAQRQKQIAAALPFGLNNGTNDAVVPTMSQIYGDLIDVCVSDHLDVVGQFRRAGGLPLSDWLPSGSRFDEERFGQVWDAIATYIARGGQLQRGDL